MSAVMVIDPVWAGQLANTRKGTDGDKWTEVWEGVIVLPTLPNDEHQEVQGRLMLPLLLLFEIPGLGKVRAGVNVTDRHPDWMDNYRGPDVVVYLTGNPAVNHGSHWVGGPDFLAEIISPGENPTAKLDFYAAVNTREVLIVERRPWALELYQLAGGKLVSAGRSDAVGPVVLASGTLPLTFQLRDGTPRPAVVVAHAATGQNWTA